MAAENLVLECSRVEKIMDKTYRYVVSRKDSHYCVGRKKRIWYNLIQRSITTVTESLYDIYYNAVTRIQASARRAAIKLQY